jgi:hypothetical protein
MADTVNGPLQALGVEDVGAETYTSDPPQHDEPELASARGLVGLGAIYEDHPEPTSKTIWEINPTHYRFVRHFFDPQKQGTGLNFVGTYTPSPSWFLENEELNVYQEFSLRNTPQFYLKSLQSQTKEIRQANLVLLLLQSMGRAVHHLQDMAQPARRVFPLSAGRWHIETEANLLAFHTPES